MSEKLSHWASIAEIASSLAVLVTLIVLIFQMRENTAAIQRQAALERTRIVSTDMINSGELPRILSNIQARDGVPEVEQAFIEEYGMSPEDSIRWARHLGFIWGAFEADYFAGIPGLEANIRFGQQFADGQLFWKMAKSQYDPEFVRWVDEEVLAGE